MIRELPHVLLVEEDHILADITAFRLELLGYRVSTVHTADETVQWLEDKQPDLIILDIALPDLDGCDLLNRISNDQATSRIPVMVFSTSSDPETVQRAFTAGAEDYVVTPFDPRMLEQKVQSLLELAGAAEGAEE